MTVALVTGVNRGIGLALVEELLHRGAHVFAVCRRSSKGLDALLAKHEKTHTHEGGRLHPVTDVDVTARDAGAALVRAVGPNKIDLLVHNAGILEPGELGHLDPEALSRSFAVNAAAPLLLTDALLASLAPKAKVAIVTSRMGSIDDNGSGGYYAYRMSKAAVNMAGKSLAVDLRPRGVTVLLLHPGFVKTEMNEGGGAIDTHTSARGMLDVLTRATLDESGAFYDYKGTAIPW